MTESKETILKRLNDTQDFCTEVEKHLEDNFLVNGKTIMAWKKYFKIDIPKDINFITIVSIVQEIWDKYQTAATFRDKQQVHLAIMEQAKSDKYNTEYNYARISTQAETGKPLAAESCKIAATLAVKDIDGAISNQKVIHGFWVKTCDTLTELRKLLEIASYAISGDAKAQRDIVIRSNTQEE